MNFKKIITTGFIVGMLSNLWGLVTCQWLFKWVYFLVPAGVCNTAMLGADKRWLLTMGALKIIIAILTTFGYALVYKAIPGKGIAKGMAYGFLLWLLGFLPSRLLLYMSTSLSYSLILYWIINDLLSYMLIGACVAALYKE